MMMTEHVAAKPCVHIRLHEHPGWAEKLREVQAGLEEEGIPCRVASCENGGFIALGYQGAQESQLGVGVGIDDEGLCIHYQKLPEKEPLFQLTETTRADAWRRIGYDAARLVKGIPFKAYERPMPDNCESAADASGEEAALRRLIEAVVRQVAAEMGKAMGR